MAQTAEFQARYMQLLETTPYIRDVADPGREIVGLETYAYNVVIGTAALPLTLANGAQTATLDTYSDSDFVLDYLSAGLNATANGNLLFNRNVSLQIQDTSTGKLFFSVPTAMASVAGAGGFPFAFTAPRVIKANVSLLFTAQNRDTVNNYNFMYVSMHGTRIFYR